jgi:hypothetical protein
MVIVLFEPSTPIPMHALDDTPARPRIGVTFVTFREITVMFQYQ